MEIKKIKLKSCLRIFPLLFLATGLVTGAFSLIFLGALPGQAPGGVTLSFWGGVISLIIYALFFSLISSSITVVAVFAYNFFSLRFGGLEIETPEEDADIEEF